MSRTGSYRPAWSSFVAGQATLPPPRCWIRPGRLPYLPGCRSRDPQVCLDDLLGDRRGRGGTEATAFYHDADSYRSVADAYPGEAGEYRVVQGRAVLRGAGLAGDLQVGHEDVVRRAGRVRHHLDHHRLQVRCHLQAMMIQ